MSEWKAVADEMPPKYTAVLCAYQGDMCVMAWSDAMHYGHSVIAWRPENIHGYDWECDFDAPTHWMPLPSPPSRVDEVDDAPSS